MPKNCNICNHKTNQYQAKLYPFIAERIGRNNDLTTLHYCKNCGFIFFDSQFSNNELSKLYTNYRDSEYQAQRQRHEPNYTVSVNDRLGDSDNEVKGKEINLLKTFSEANINPNLIKSVLDFGGDKGQNIAITAFKDAEKYLYDISEISPVAGVAAINDLLEKKFDLVISQHTLEHVPDPMGMVKEAVNCLNPGGYFYFELPDDSPIKNYDFFRKFVFKFLEKYSDRKMKRKNKYFWMHEHINFFEKETLKNMFKNAGLEIFYFGRNKSEFGEVIFGIGRKEIL